MELWAYDPYNEWPEMMAPSRLWNQDFGSGLFNEPMFGPFDLPRSVYRRRPTKLSKSEVVSDKDKFQVTIDLADFEVKEISVKIIDNSLVVHAEHEEKPDEAGHVYRKLNRRYILPRTVDQDNISSTFSDNGTLVITAPKKPKEQSGNERIVEVKMQTTEEQTSGRLEPMETEQKGQKGQKESEGIKIPVKHEK